MSCWPPPPASRSRSRAPTTNLLARVLAARGAEVAVAAGGLRIVGLDAAGVGDAALDAGVALRELLPVGADLQDVFMQLTAGAGIA